MILQKIKKLLLPTPLLHVSKTGSGPTILFLHGIGSSSGSWHTLLPLLSKNYTCITIDLLGFGGSPKPDWLEYTIQDHIVSIAKTVRSLKLNEPCILVGHSLGSLLACRYAALNKKQIKALFLVSPPVYLAPSQYSKVRTKNTADLYFKLYKFLRSHKSFTIRNANFLAKFIPGKGVVDISEATWVPFTKTLENCIENQTLITDIAAIKAPTEAIYGSLDQFIIQGNMRLLDAFENTKVTKVIGADHIIRKNLAKTIAQKIIALEN